MTNTQLLLSIAVPGFLILIGILFNHARFNALESRLLVIEGDLRRFYVDLGRHEGEISILKERKH